MEQQPEGRRTTEGKEGLSGHRANLCELSATHLLKQVGYLSRLHQEGSLQHIQGTVPAIVVAMVEQELELSHEQRQIDFGDTTEGADHGMQPRSGAFHGVALDFAAAIAILVEGIFASAMIDGLVAVTFAGQEMVDRVAIGVDLGAAAHHLVDNRADGVGLDILQDEQAHLSASAQQAKHGQAVTLPGTPAASFQAARAWFSFQFQATSIAFQSSGDVDFVELGHIFWLQDNRFLRTGQVESCSQQSKEAVRGMPVDLRFFSVLDARFAIGKGLQHQPERRNIVLHPVKRGTRQRSEGTSFTGVSSLGADFAAPTSQTSVVRKINAVDTRSGGITFSTRWAARTMWPAYSPQHVPQFLGIHLINPATAIPQIRQGIHRLVSCFSNPRLSCFRLHSGNGHRQRSDHFSKRTFSPMGLHLLERKEPPPFQPPPFSPDRITAGIACLTNSARFFQPAMPNRCQMSRITANAHQQRQNQYNQP